MNCSIEFLWDTEAGVWVATSEDVPGLALESESFDALLEKVRVAVPGLLEINGRKAPCYDISFASERRERVPACG